jgi:alkanesulfonate monooxygenase SsuD/methylene tetrahydromethanopterin reductase-like flavin-dependent oxidoreductase (luciferase family)
MGSTLSRIARTCDDGGFASLSVMDHFFQLGTEYGSIHGPIDAPMLEGPSTIAYLAGVTSRVQLGVLVSCCLYRPPALLVKAFTTIDVLSGGRTFFGVGAGWFAHEASALGIGPMPSWRERFERLEETVKIANQMWGDGPASFRGRHYAIHQALNHPRPITRPHPPIFVGGSSDRTLRLVAQYADACNLVCDGQLAEFGTLSAPLERVLAWVDRRLAFLRHACEEVGRPYDSVRKTIATYVHIARGAQSAPEVADIMSWYREMGIDRAILVMPNAHEISPLEEIAEHVIPALADHAPLVDRVAGHG